MTNQIPAPQQARELIVGRMLHLGDLQGRFRKWLTVPDGYRGVAIYPDGNVRLFDPGRHIVLKFGERANGKGIGLRVGLLSSAPFTRFLPAAGLRSWNGVLLKAALSLRVDIDAPVRFLEQAPAVAGQLDAPSPDPYQACQQIRPLVRNFDSADLLSGAAAAQLTPQLARLLEPMLANNGMRLLDLQPPAFIAAEEELQAAAQEQASAENLKKIIHEAELADLERQAEKEDFERQLKGEPAPVAESSPPAPAPVEPAVITPDNAPAAAPVPAQVTVPESAAPVQAGPLAFSVPPAEKQEIVPLDGNQMFSIQRPAAQPPLRPLPPGYMNRQLIKIILSLVGIFAFTFVADPLLQSLKLSNAIEVRGLLTALWASILVFSGKTVWDIYDRVTNEEKKCEFVDLPQTELDDIAFSQHTTVDGFMRDQSNQELAGIQAKVHRSWHNLLRRGQREAAGSLNRLEPKIEELAQRVLDPAFGMPSFQAGHGSPNDLPLRQIEYDQELLLFLDETADQANLLEKKSVDQTVSLEEAAGLEKQIYEFDHRFGNRRRPPRP